MLLISRSPSESVMVNDDLLLKVVEIDTTRVSIIVYRRPPGGRLSSFHEFGKAWLKCRETISLGHDASCSAVDIQGGRVQLGFTGPKEMTVQRREAFDAIRQERGGDEKPGSAGLR
jgi:sRNA-binding carbon storage regulator CsrA